MTRSWLVARRRGRRGLEPARRPRRRLDRGAVRDRRGVGRRRRPRRAARAARGAAADRELRTGSTRPRTPCARSSGRSARRRSSPRRRASTRSALPRGGSSRRSTRRAVAVHGRAEGRPGNDRRAPAGGRGGLPRAAAGLTEAGFAAPASARLDRWRAAASFPFGGDPEEILRGLREFAETPVGERQGGAARAVRDADAEHRRRAHRRRARSRCSRPAGPDEQAVALRDAMRVLFPEAVALVSAARQGFMREG